MFDPVAVIKRNSETFYNYKTEEPRTQRYRLGAEIVLAALLTTAFQDNLSTFITAVTAVQAIVLGFAFNVMFFLMSDAPPSQTYESIEDKLRTSHVFKLKRELFYNISYFILVAMASLLLAFLLLMPSGWGIIGHVMIPLPLSKLARSVGRWTQITAFLLILLGFYASTLESAVSFVRVVGRVNFLFERKREALER